MRVIVHAMSGCSHCEWAKEYLADKNVPFTVILHDDPAERNLLYDKLHLTGADRTMPQVALVDDDGEMLCIGGYGSLKVSGLTRVALGE